MPSSTQLDSILGATYIGIVISAMYVLAVNYWKPSAHFVSIGSIFGVTCLQVYLYYTEHSASDGRFLRVFVRTISYVTSTIASNLWLLR